MVGALLLLLLWGCTGVDDPSDGPTSSVAATTRPAADGPSAAPSVVEATPVLGLTVVDRKDGDSFGASDGEEYRVGLVNTPEQGACGGDQAAEVTYDLLADGFASDIYARDQHGRAVARITTATGDLGVLLAGGGWADDRYLEDFRHENPAYAAELDTAFAQARQDGAGLWATCWAPQAQRADGPPMHVGDDRGYGCHPAYVECLPDGPDLDCAEVDHQVRLTGQADPYRLDGNSLTATDGVGCDTYEAFDPSRRYAYQP